jgi:hypothetical protein
VTKNTSFATQKIAPGLGPINKNYQILEIFRKSPEHFKQTIFVREVRKII